MSQLDLFIPLNGYVTANRVGCVMYGLRKNSFMVNLNRVVEMRNALASRRVKAIPANSRVHFSKSVDFSRQKFRDWGAKSNISISRNAHKSDVIVVDYAKFNNFISAIENVPVAFHCFKEWGYYRIHTIASFRETEIHTETVPFIEGMLKGEVDEIINLNEVLDANVKIISAKDLHKLVITEKMTEDVAQNIRDMLKGVNEDKELGVEFLSNYSWTQSAFQIAEIFYDCWSDIIQTQNYQSVTFAHLRPMFDNFYNDYRYHDEKIAIAGFLASEGRNSLVDNEKLASYLRPMYERNYHHQLISYAPVKGLKYTLKNATYEVQVGPEKREVTIDIFYP